MTTAGLGGNALLYSLGTIGMPALLIGYSVKAMGNFYPYFHVTDFDSF